MTRFRNPGQREAAWGKWLGRRGVTWGDVLADERPPYPSERVHIWRLRYERVPVELRVGSRT